MHILMCMRTMISLDDGLHRRAKAYAARHGTTLTALVEEALRARATAPSVTWRPVGFRIYDRVFAIPGARIS